MYNVKYADYRYWPADELKFLKNGTSDCQSVFSVLYGCGVYRSAESLKKWIAAVDLGRIFEIECLSRQSVLAGRIN